MPAQKKNPITESFQKLEERKEAIMNFVEGLDFIPKIKREPFLIDVENAYYSARMCKDAIREDIGVFSVTLQLAESQLRDFDFTGDLFSKKLTGKEKQLFSKLRSSFKSAFLRCTSTVKKV